MIKKLYKEMSVAQILSSMTVIICLLIDSIMIGRFLGVDSMAAYGLANPLLLVFSALASMLSSGISVVCGKTIGKGDKKGTNGHFSTAIIISSIILVIGILVVIIFRSQVACLLGAEQGTKIHELTSSYLLGFIIGAPAFFFAMLMIPFVQFAGEQKRLILAVAIMTFGDILFDILNVFVFKGGMLGMGLASSLSYYAAIIVGLPYFFNKDCIFKFSLKSFSKSRLVELLKAGIPTIINMLSTVMLTYTFNQILIRISGSRAVAAYSIIATIGNLCYAFCIGFAGVILILAGVYYFEEDRLSLVELVKVMVKSNAWVDFIVALVAIVFAPFIVKLFLGNDPTAAPMAVIGVRIFALSVVPSSLNTAFKHFYQGTGRLRTTKALSILQNFAAPTFFAFVLSFFAGTNGVWSGYVFGELTVLALICINAWRFNKKITFSASAFAMLEKKFGVGQKDTMNMEIMTPQDVIKASQASTDYCINHGKTNKASMYVGLCIEELCNNIIKYGFNDGKNHLIDLKLFVKKDELLIRIKDDCASFDPVNYLKSENPDDKTHHIGIKMVSDIAKSFNYTNTMSLNNITITLGLDY
ncbi:MAG: ATP-binding protein [Eubacterium sp.]|nr:ATP-binding protein [Eubacterium sp.]